jgi:hypothetical protein
LKLLVVSDCIAFCKSSNIKERIQQKDDERKIQRVIDHYAIEYDNMLVFEALANFCVRFVNEV